MATLTKPRKKRRVHQPEESPFPIPIETITHKPASNNYWFYYQAELIGDNVVVQREGDILFLHKMGFFGKGILSRSKPEHQFFASSFQGSQRKNLPPKERRFQQQRFQQVRQHKYERHLMWQRQASSRDKHGRDKSPNKDTRTPTVASPRSHESKTVRKVKRASISVRNRRAGLSIGTSDVKKLPRAEDKKYISGNMPESGMHDIHAPPTGGSSSQTHNANQTPTMLMEGLLTPGETGPHGLGASSRLPGTIGRVDDRDEVRYEGELMDDGDVMRGHQHETQNVNRMWMEGRELGIANYLRGGDASSSVRPDEVRQSERSASKTEPSQTAEDNPSSMTAMIRQKEQADLPSTSHQILPTSWDTREEDWLDVGMDDKQESAKSVGDVASQVGDSVSEWRDTGNSSWTTNTKDWDDVMGELGDTSYDARKDVSRVGDEVVSGAPQSITTGLEDISTTHQGITVDVEEGGAITEEQATGSRETGLEKDATVAVDTDARTVERDGLGITSMVESEPETLPREREDNLDSEQACSSTANAKQNGHTEMQQRIIIGTEMADMDIGAADRCYSDDDDDDVVAVPMPVDYEDATTSQTEINNLLSLRGATQRRKAKDPKTPVRKKDPYPIYEYLQLSYEEAFFLSYGLGCLSILDHNKKPMNLTELWQWFKSRRSNFVAKYIVYHYFRSKGWVPKTGLKFGADIILYKKGPPFYHASYSIKVFMLNEDDLELGADTSKPKMTWPMLTGMNRVIEHAAKELMFCYVIKPRNMTPSDMESPACIPRFKVQEMIMKRWVPSRERQVKYESEEL